MLIEEARWLGGWIASQKPADVYPMCNLGSSTLELRTVIQPWIDRELFFAAREAGHEVVHVDRKAVDGVDLVGDVTNPAFAATLRRRRFRTVLCSNLLEHVTDIEGTCELLRSLVPPDGHLVITGPFRYPYHLDPIDNGLRESPADLARRFPTMRVAAAATIVDGSYARYLFRSPRAFAAQLLDLVAIWRGVRWAAGVRRWGWIHRRFAATALVLRASPRDALLEPHDRDVAATRNPERDVLARR